MYYSVWTRPHYIDLHAHADNKQEVYKFVFKKNLRILTWLCDVIDDVIITQIIVFDTICILSIRKLHYLGCHINIAIGMPYFFVIIRIIKCEMQLLIHSQTSNAAPLKFGNWYVIPSHILQWV